MAARKEETRRRDVLQILRSGSHDRPSASRGARALFHRQRGRGRQPDGIRRAAAEVRPRERRFDAPRRHVRRGFPAAQH